MKEHFIITRNCLVGCYQAKCDQMFLYHSLSLWVIIESTSAMCAQSSFLDKFLVAFVKRNANITHATFSPRLWRRNVYYKAICDSYSYIYSYSYNTTQHT